MRIALLNGLSPKENREIPPLRYDEVYRLKRDFPDLRIEINGGIKTVADIQEHWRHTDGVMIGRARRTTTPPRRGTVALETAPPSRHEILRRWPAVLWPPNWPMVIAPLSQMTRHILGLFQGLPARDAGVSTSAVSPTRNIAVWSLSGKPPGLSPNPIVLRGSA